MSQPIAITHEAKVATAVDDVPKPCTVTPGLLKLHSITDEEYAKILATMGRTPSLTELGIYSVMWSEHCSYKSSRVHLKRLPTKGFRESGPGAVMQGPGENAGIIDVGDGWACAFKIESHNHPSYIEPYQGAATGVGGILRDIFTMGARPMAVMDSLRFGPLTSRETGNREQGTGPAPAPIDSSSRPEQSEVEEPTPSLSKRPASRPAAEPFGGATEDTSEEADAAENTVPCSLFPVPSIDYAKNRSVMEGVVHGVAGYGNCFGVPNLGGETRFEECYSGNPLLNAFALGLVRHDEIFYAKATGIGNPVIYVGAKTGRDGIHGATMASEEFTEGSEQKRPNVQMGDPFLEKLLLEACLEAMKTGAVSGIQDMGAAGLTCSTCEMGGRGGVGLEIELDMVPQRDSGMSSYEIMLSESQERMLLVAHAGREGEVLEVFDKWGLDAAVVGTVIPENRMKVRHGGELVADLSNESLTDDAPVYHRPVGEWKAPVPLDPPAWVLEELKKPRDYTADLKKLLASANICSKAHIYEQYDSMVQTNTVFGPGQAEAGVIRIKGTGGQGTGNREQGSGTHASRAMHGAPTFSATTGAGLDAGEGAPYIDSDVRDGSATKTERGLAMALAGNGRWCYLDPKLGAMHAVAEAARKVACTGATPVAATNCLNFGNPMKPEIMAQLSQAIDGISEACTALGTPITGGNVSLYNETKGEGIYPTPVIGIIGILDDVTKAVPSDFKRPGDAVILVDCGSSGDQTALIELGSSEYAKVVLGALWGAPPQRWTRVLEMESALQKGLIALGRSGLRYTCRDAADGLAVALAEGCLRHRVGVDVTLLYAPTEPAFIHLFSETSARAVITCSMEDVKAVQTCFGEGSSALQIGSLTNGFIHISVQRYRLVEGAGRDRFYEKTHVEDCIRTDVNELLSSWSGVLNDELENQVVLA